MYPTAKRSPLLLSQQAQVAASCSGSAACARALGRQLIFRGAAGTDSAVLEAGSNTASVMTTAHLYLHIPGRSVARKAGFQVLDRMTTQDQLPMQ